MGTWLPGDPAAPAALTAALALILALCTAADLRSRIVPDPVLAAGALFALLLMAVARPELLAGRTASALGAGAFLLAPALLFPGSMGMGDVKLAAVLGLYLGAAVITALLAAFVAGTLAGVILVIRHGPEARRMTIPFVPYLALGAAVALA